MQTWQGAFGDGRCSAALQGCGLCHNPYLRLPTPLTGASTAEQAWSILLLGLLSRVLKGIALLVHLALVWSPQAAGTAELSDLLCS